MFKKYRIKNISQIFSDNSEKSDRFIFFILILIIILSSLLRVYYLSSESLWLDEGVSIDISKGSILEIFDRANTDPHPPLYYIILHFWMILFGDGEFSIRFMSIIFGIISVYIIFKFGKLMFNNNVGILSAFIFSISLFHIKYSQIARSYSLLVLVVLLSNYYFVRILTDNKDRNETRKSIIGYIIFSIAMIYTHVYGLFYLIFQNTYYFLFHKKNIKSWILTQCTILFFYMLWVPFLFKRLTISIERNLVALNLKTIPTLDSVYETFKTFAGSEQILYIYIVIIIIGLTIKRYNKKDIHNHIFLILWLFSPIIISFMISYTIGPLYVDRYLIASLPALILIFSVGMLNFKKNVIILALLLITFLQIPLIGDYYDNIEREQWRDAVYYIKDIKEDHDIILLYPNFTEIPFNYYYKNSPDYIGINDSLEINNIVDNHDRVWLIFSHMTFTYRMKESKLIEKELSKTYIKKGVTNFSGINVYLYVKK